MRERERLTHLNILRGWTTFGFFHSVDCVDAFYRSVHFSSCLAILRSSLLDRQLIKHGWSTAQFFSAADGAFYKHRDLLLEYFVIYYCYYRLVLEQWWRLMYSWWVSPAYNTHAFPIAIWWPFPTGGTPIMTCTNSTCCTDDMCHIIPVLPIRLWNKDKSPFNTSYKFRIENLNTMVQT